jgi:phosphoglucomutase
LAGVALDADTRAAVNRITAEAMGRCFETPTGWKFFGNLLDARRWPCGEEVPETGDHVTERWRLFVLLWLNILAERRNRC